jgi:hypothetical protein
MRNSLFYITPARANPPPVRHFRDLRRPVKITPIMHAGCTPASSYRQGARTFTSIRCKAADLTLIIDRLKGPHTQIFGPRAAADKIHVIRSSPTAKPKGEQWTIEAVPAYNLQRGPSVGRLSHDKGCGNGCILNYGRRITAGELRQAFSLFRRHGSHSGNACPPHYRRGVCLHESALHDDPETGIDVRMR